MYLYPRASQLYVSRVKNHHARAVRSYLNRILPVETDWVIDLRGRFSFGEEAVGKVMSGGEDRDRDGLVEERVDAAVEFTEPGGAEVGVNAVLFSDEFSGQFSWHL